MLKLAIHRIISVAEGSLNPKPLIAPEKDGSEAPRSGCRQVPQEAGF